MGEATDNLTTISADGLAAADGDVAATAATASATPGAGSRLPGGLKLPALKLPVKLAAKLALPRFPLRPTAFRLPRPGRPAMADLVFSAGAASLVLSVLFVVSEPVRARLQARSDEAAIAASAATLQLAAETHAAANGGQYARNALELLPWLPGGEAPRNPYTRDRTLFRGIAGDLTYRPAPGGGYVIEAWGKGAARPRLLATLRGVGPASGH